MYTEAEGMKRRLIGVMASGRGSAMIICGQDHIYIYDYSFCLGNDFVVMMMHSISGYLVATRLFFYTVLYALSHLARPFVKIPV